MKPTLKKRSNENESDLGGNLRITRTKSARYREELQAHLLVEEKLRLSEARLKAILSAALEPIILFDSQGLIRECNPAAERVFGRTRLELLETYISELLPGLADSLREKGKSRPFLSLLGRTVKFHGVRGEGNEFPVELSLTAVEGPRAKMYSVFVRDITEREEEERKRSEILAKLTASRAYLRTVLRQMPSGVVVIDSRGQVFLHNQIAQRILNLPRESTDRPAPFSRVRLFQTDGSEVSSGKDPMTRALRQEEVIQGEEYLLNYGEGHRRFVAISAAPIHAGLREPVGAVGDILDITERKKSERELKKQMTAIERMNQELSQFVYIASHDLQEPLRTVASFAQLLSRRYSGKLDSTADEYINFVVDGAKHLQNLIRSLGEYSRAARGDISLTYIEASKSLDTALQGLHSLIVQTEAKIDAEELPTVLSDPIQLSQVFQNLLSNALKFRGECPPQIRIRAEDTAGGWVFSISDNGIGFESEESEQIFQIFRRLHARNVYEGTGTGLAICKKIVDRHGGRIWAESKPGAGSTFYFLIPHEVSGVRFKDAKSA
ncbi:MAG TPA: PAS domain S-box protein [Bdellovibrionota bacterium]|nr:PAS domain S-box protein [Bdellovibrionota bacterium]